MTSDITPFNIRIMDVDNYVARNFLQPVTSLLIYEPSSPKFHPQGLFSEEIFGAIGTEERLLTPGYIDLNTIILAPVLYHTVLKLSGFYGDLMAGRVYSVWNTVTKSFDRVDGDPEAVVGADTGYSFFLQHFAELEFKTTASAQRETRLKLIDTYRNIGLYSKYLVEPAGLRDLSNDDNGKMIQDDINKLYLTLMAYASSIPPGSKSPLYDSIRYHIQMKALEIYEYIENIMIHKRGFLQGHWGHRQIAMGTRNVISVASYNTQRPDDPQTLGPNATKVGVFQTMKSLQPLIVHGFKTVFIDPIFAESNSQTVTLIDPKTLTLSYQTITEEERLRFNSNEQIDNWINRFRKLSMRDKPITIYDVNNKPFYLWLVYDQGDRITLFRSIADLKVQIAPNKVEIANIHPITWIEAFYLITANAAMGRHAFVTRYPVLHDTSCYPTTIHTASTTPARVVELYNLLDPGGYSIVYPEYPILGEPYLDTVVPGSGRLAGLGGDQAFN